MNLQEDYCSYELSKLLKEKGFNIPSNYAWHGGIKEPDFHRKSRNFNGGEYKDLRTKWYSAPTHQMAMKWLRENEIYITIKPFKLDGKIVYTIVYLIGAKDDESMFVFDTYEEAVEAAIKYSLENLI